MNQTGKKHVLITGASGFIGSHTVHAFLGKGYLVKAQFRRSTPPPRLSRHEGPDCRLVKADLSDKAAVKELVKDVDYIVHIAGLTSDWGPYERFYRVNYLGTKFLADAALENGVKVFTCISSTAVHGFGGHIDSSEDGPYYPHISNYQKTKKLAEDYVLGLNSKKMRVSALRPGNVYGPEDTTVMYSYFDQIMKGILPLVGRGKSITCPVYISDMVNAILIATESSASSGRIYNITSGEMVTWKEIMDLGCKYLGKKPLIISVPYRTGRLIAAVATFFAKLFRIDSNLVLTRYKIDQGGLNYHFDITRASDELSYKPAVMIDEGMKKTAAAYLDSIKDRAKLRKKR